MGSQISQVIDFAAQPEQVFDELLDAELFAGFSCAPATVGRHTGDGFSLFGDQIQGRNLEIVPAELIVQAWRVAGWDRGLYSIVRFELAPATSGTTLRFNQVGFPEDAHDELDAGWHQMYWEPMRRHLEP